MFQKINDIGWLTFTLYTSPTLPSAVYPLPLQNCRCLVKHEEPSDGHLSAASLRTPSAAGRAPGSWYRGSISASKAVRVSSPCQNVAYIFTPHSATVCNGRSELCDRRYGNTTFLTAHNSFAFSSNPLAREPDPPVCNRPSSLTSRIVARNQVVDVPSQMNIGARVLQGQAHMVNGKLRFCHTSASLPSSDRGTVR